VYRGARGTPEFVLITIDDLLKRAHYKVECLRRHWPLRELNDCPVEIAVQKR
jgi:hypothetical protein